MVHDWAFIAIKARSLEQNAQLQNEAEMLKNDLGE